MARSVLGTGHVPLTSTPFAALQSQARLAANVCVILSRRYARFQLFGPLVRETRSPEECSPHARTWLVRMAFALAKLIVALY